MTRRRTRLVAVALAASLALSSCGTAGGSGGGLPTIVVTTNILGDVVKQVAGDAAEVTTLMRPNADPHSFEISAKEAAGLRDADLVVSNGLGLEEALQRHLDRAADADVDMFVAGDHVEVLDYSAGEARGAPDPHFWTDPARMLAMVDALEKALMDVDGIDRATVQQRAKQYREQIERLDTDMAAAFAEIPQQRRRLVTNHHVFGYLAERFDFEIVGAVIPGGTTLAAPSAADLHDLADAIEKAGVRAIFAESSQPDRLMRVLANEVGIEVEVIELFTESLTPAGEGADTYLAMMRANTERIANGLSP